jgi:hypothetical protein
MRPKPREAWTALASELVIHKCCQTPRRDYSNQERSARPPTGWYQYAMRMTKHWQAHDPTWCGSKVNFAARIGTKPRTANGPIRPFKGAASSCAPPKPAGLRQRRGRRAEVSLLPRLVEEEEQTEQAVRRLKPERKTDSGDSRVKGDRATDDR